MQPRRALRPLHRGGGSSVLVILGLGGFVVWVYVVVVLGGGAVIGRTDSPSLALSVVATTVVALSFARVQAALERAAVRWGLGRAAPYDVLRHFSDDVTSAYTTDNLSARMAKLLAEGTGATWAQVWLSVSGRMTLAAAWPADADADPIPPSPRSGQVAMTDPRVRSLPVRHGGQLLGVLRLRERPGLPLTLVEQRLFAGLAAQAGFVLRGVGLQAELDDRRGQLLVRSGEISASRKRLIKTQDAERSRLERDLHDGAQQHLVALTVNLRLTHTLVGRSPERASALLAQQAVAAQVAIDTLSALSRGIYPEQLAQDGLGAALRSAVSGSAIPITVHTYAPTRPPAAVEAALYFCGMEAVQNAAKHSGAGTVLVRLDEAPGRWRLTVSDDGTGFDRDAGTASGVGLANMGDRLDAVGGTLHVASAQGTGTTVTAVVPRTHELVSADAASVLLPSYRGG